MKTFFRKKSVVSLYYFLETIQKVIMYTEIMLY